MKQRPQREATPWVREESMPAPDDLAWLVSPEGQSVCAAMAGDRPADTPSAIQHWRERLPAEHVAAAWAVVLCRRSAHAKFTRADDMLFDRVGLEQSTDEVVAAHKARRFAGCARVADLCCGIGGDSLAMAACSQVAAVDWLLPRVMMAEHNARVYGHAITSLPGDVRTTWPDADAVHIDPDRRPAGRREHQPDQGSPNWTTVEEIVAHYQHAAIKLSPGVDYDELAGANEVELISHHGNCKQAVIWTGKLRTAYRRATVLPAGATIAADDKSELAWPAPVAPQAGTYLLEPDHAVIRAHLVGPLSRMLDATTIDSNIAWLACDQPVSSPLVHTFQIIDQIPFAEKKLRAWLQGHDVGRLEIKTRGIAASPEEIGRRLRLNGSRSLTLLVTRLRHQPVAFLAMRQ